MECIPAETKDKKKDKHVSIGTFYQQSSCNEDKVNINWQNLSSLIKASNIFRRDESH